MSWSKDLADAVTVAGRAPVLLVACDYDGTLAPIVDDPARAFPLRPAIAALRGLAALPDTHVAVISGRSLRDLAVLSRLPQEVHLVGSHGSEFEPDSLGRLDATQRGLLDQLQGAVEEIAASLPGCVVEVKPAGVAFHYRRASEQDGRRGRLRVLEGPGRLEGVRCREGKCVVELSVVLTDKGEALQHLRRQLGADAVMFVGDDATDEDAFVTLKGPDVSVKVGEGPTRAVHRVDEPEDVCDLLCRLQENRSDWVSGYRTPAIERHTLLSDQHTVALVDPEGRISWMCHPRADGQALFAELLGGPTAGFFAVRPASGGGAASQRYVSDTLLVETRWSGLRVVDYLDTSQVVGSASDTRSWLLRVIEGEVPAEVVFAPRLDFGRNVTELEVIPNGISVVGGPDPLILHSPGVTWTVEHDGRHQTARAVVDPSGGAVVLELRLGGEPDPGPVDGRPEGGRRSATADFWGSRLAPLRLPPVAAAVVRRSALTLEALRYRPTGAIIAAATTSLPETIGGVRNWDYRFCWPRDAAMAATSLARLGSFDAGLAFLDWLCDRADHSARPDLLRPVYRVTGDDAIPEAAIAELAGYAGSRPVRIGNAAENQIQLDALGPVVDLIHQLFSSGAGLRPRHWALTRRVLDVVTDLWHEPDHGIWEVRLARRHHVMSKIMCWTACDRAIRLAEITGREAPERWVEVRSRLVEDVCEHGWDADRGTFVAAYGTTDLDASLLLLGTCGFVSPRDERYLSTVEAVERELCEGLAVYRYRFDDGLPGEEGGFLLCAGWMVQALAACGRVDEAVDRFDRLIGLAGPTGLLPEQVHPRTERTLGNHPQAYSHMAVIDSALALAAAGVRG